MVTIIIVTFNADKTLQNCLNSIYEQKSDRLKIIVIDGGSTDNTVAILEKNNNKIFFWKSEKDAGIYDAMNKALEYLDTEWVYFLGADDELLNDFSGLTDQLKNPHFIYYGNVIYKGQKHSGEVTSYRQAKLGLFHQSIIYPSTIFKKYRYNTRYKIAADYALNMQLNRDRDYKFHYIDFTIAKYNHTGISSVNLDHEFEKDKLRLILKNFETGVILRYCFRQSKQLLKKG